MSSTMLAEGFSTKKLSQAFGSVRRGLGERLRDIKKVVERLIKDLSSTINPEQSQKISILMKQIIESIEQNSSKSVESKIEEINEIVEFLSQGVDKFNIEEKLLELGKKYRTNFTRDGNRNGNVNKNGDPGQEEQYSNAHVHTFYENGEDNHDNQIGAGQYYETIINTYGVNGKKKERNKRDRQKRKRQLSKNSDEEAPKVRRNRHVQEFELQQQIIESMKFSSKNIIPPSSSYDIHSNSMILENQRHKTTANNDYLSITHHDRDAQDRLNNNEGSSWSKNNITNSQKSIHKEQYDEEKNNSRSSWKNKNNKRHMQKTESINNLLTVENERTTNSHNKDQTSSSSDQESFAESLEKSGKFNIYGQKVQEGERMQGQEQGQDQNFYSFRSSTNPQNKKKYCQEQQQSKYSGRISKKSSHKNKKGNHPDYNIAISEKKIDEMLKKIRNRIMVSCAVIDGIEYERDNKGQNQRQIDNRVRIEFKNTDSLTNLIGQRRQIWKSPGKSPQKSVIKPHDLWREVQNIRMNLQK